MFLKCLLLLVFSAVLEAQFPYHRTSLSCPYPRLDHGRVRFRQKPRMVKFMCSFRYELVGNRYATCRNGRWDVPMPVCVKPGCPDLPTPEHSVQNKEHFNAWVLTFCMSGYTLVGSSTMYCNGSKWNATNPSCVATKNLTSLSCDFEDSNICGWRQDEMHDFDWVRINKKTPSNFLNTGPAYDHTLGEGHNGYYMYIESTAKVENSTARLISPVFNSYLAISGCFSFFYHMYGRTTGALRIYQKPESLPLTDMLSMNETAKAEHIIFEQWGNLGDFWYSAAPPLKDFSESFQIVIEGIRGSSVTSDIAVDDVALLQGENCTYFRIAATSPAPNYVESCLGRCFTPARLSAYVCGCTIACMVEENCCPDFVDLCVFNNRSSGATDQDDPSPSDSPQTEKLVGEITTTSERSKPAFTSPELPRSWTTTSSTSTTTTRYTPIAPYTRFTPYTPTTPHIPIAPYTRFTPYTPTTPHVPITPYTPIAPYPRFTPYTPTTPYIPNTPYTPTTSSTSTTTSTTSTTHTTAPTAERTTPPPTTIPTPRTTLTSTTVKPKTTLTTTNRPPTKATTTKVMSTQKVTTKKFMPTTNKPTTLSTKIANITKIYLEEKQKREKEITMQRVLNDKPVAKKSSTWKTAVITIVILSMFVGLVYLAVAARTARGRATLALLRGRVSNTQVSEVRYLNSNSEDDL